MLVFVSVISVTFAAVYHSGYAEDCTIGSSENATDLCPNSFGCTIDGIGYIEPGSHKDLENCKSYFCHCSSKSSSQWIRSQTVARKWEKQTSYESCSFSAADIGMYCHFSDECEEIFNEPCHPTIVLKSNHDQMCPRVGCVGR